MNARPSTPASSRQRETENGLKALDDAFRQLGHSPRWSDWAEQDDRLAGCVDLAEAVQAWGRREKQCGGIISALTALASRRGGDDDDAALAVMVLMRDAWAGLLRSHGDVATAGEVVSTAWEFIKAAEPNPGPSAASFLFKRTRKALVQRAQPRATDQLQYENCPEIADRGVFEEIDDPLRDVVDLLEWARSTGVVEPKEFHLFVELMTAVNQGQLLQEAFSTAAERRGVAWKTVDRQRVAVQTKLREALPEYLAATA